MSSKDTRKWILRRFISASIEVVKPYVRYGAIGFVFQLLASKGDILSSFGVGAIAIAACMVIDVRKIKNKIKNMKGCDL